MVQSLKLALFPTISAKNAPVLASKACKGVVETVYDKFVALCELAVTSDDEQSIFEAVVFADLSFQWHLLLGSLQVRHLDVGRT